MDESHLVGYTEDRHAEFIRRPIIVSALELCTPQVVDLLLNFGADLAKYHEGLCTHSTNEDAVSVVDYWWWFRMQGSQHFAGTAKLVRSRERVYSPCLILKQPVLLLPLGYCPL